MISQRRDWLHDWHVNPSVNKDYDFVDGLRGIAILLVIGCHLVYTNPLSANLTRFIGGVISGGACGVTVFFSLSGFLISWPFWKRKVKGQAGVIPSGYAWRRFWKTYPPLALSVVLLTPIYILRSHDRSFVPLALQWMAGLPLFKPVSGALNPVMWSLVVEVHFYILLPLVFVALKKVPARTTLWIVFVAFLVIPTAWRWFNAANGVYFTLHPQINVHFPSMLDAFAFGILVAGLDNLQLLRKPWACLGDAGLVLLLVALIVFSWMGLYSSQSVFVRSEVLLLTATVASFFLLFYAADPNHPRSIALSVPWLRWCGLISYEWYLFHQPIILWVRALLGPTGGNVFKYSAIVAISVITSCFLAAVVYRYFSLPILKYGRSKAQALKPTLTSGPGALRELEKTTKVLP